MFDGSSPPTVLGMPDISWEPLVNPPGPAGADTQWWCVQGNRLLLGADGSVPVGATVDTAGVKGAASSPGLFLGMLD